MRNDVALVYLKENLPVDLNSNTIKRATLNDDPNCAKAGDMCKVAGWGNLEYGKEKQQ